MAGIRFQCPACGQHLEAPVEASGLAVACPTCQAGLHVPADTGAAPAKPVPPPGDCCAFCQSPLEAAEPLTSCPACGAKYHAECWQENGGCAVYGCSRAPQVEQRRAIEIPISYWGRESKPCPACGREILAAAVRCRHCGATFSSAQPEDTDEYQRRSLQAGRLPGMKRMVTVLFIFSVVPCLAPIGAVWGLIWYPLNRENLRALPSVFPALCKIGLVVAIGQCVLLALMATLFALIRGAG